MTNIALDTVYVAAQIDSRDKWHPHATSIQSSLIDLRYEYVLLDPVINETISVLARRLREQGRTEEFPALLTSLMGIASRDQVTWISSLTRRLYPEIIDLIRVHEGRLNFHDALIALACRELEISLIASFDRDFDEISWLTRIASPTDLAPGSASQTTSSDR